MPIGTEELQAMRDALIRARASGVRVVQYEGNRTEYASDAEMSAALADLERRIASGTGRRSAGSIRFITSKGV
jgi:phosphatidylserine/phosphatidylglycerophosphate/cardiolipin synthase-like enzyme